MPLPGGFPLDSILPERAEQSPPPSQQGPQARLGQRKTWESPWPWHLVQSEEELVFLSRHRQKFPGPFPPRGHCACPLLGLLPVTGVISASMEIALGGAGRPHSLPLLLICLEGCGDLSIRRARLAGPPGR